MSTLCDSAEVQTWPPAHQQRRYLWRHGGHQISFFPEGAWRDLTLWDRPWPVSISLDKGRPGLLSLAYVQDWRGSPEALRPSGMHQQPKLWASHKPRVNPSASLSAAPCADPSQPPLRPTPRRSVHKPVFRCPDLPPEDPWGSLQKVRKAEFGQRRALKYRSCFCCSPPRLRLHSLPLKSFPVQKANSDVVAARHRHDRVPQAACGTRSRGDTVAESDSQQRIVECLRLRLLDRVLRQTREDREAHLHEGRWLEASVPHASVLLCLPVSVATHVPTISI